MCESTYAVGIRSKFYKEQPYCSHRQVAFAILIILFSTRWAKLSSTFFEFFQKKFFGGICLIYQDFIHEETLVPDAKTIRFRRFSEILQSTL